jgi:phosphoglycerate dehydrogenase-like enzyme
MLRKAFSIIESFADEYCAKMLEAYPDLEVDVTDLNDKARALSVDLDAIFARCSTLDDGLDRAAQNLQSAHFLSSGMDALARLPALNLGVAVTSSHRIDGRPISKMAFLRMMALARNNVRIKKSQEIERWRSSTNLSWTVRPSASSARDRSPSTWRAADRSQGEHNDFAC